MPIIDWQDEDQRPEYKEKYKDGDVVLGYVDMTGCEERLSKKQEAYFSVKFVDKEGDRICWDVIMLQGRGAGMGSAKLKALGFEGNEQSIELHELNGRSAWLMLQEDEFKGKKRIEVKPEWGDSESPAAWRAGYWPARQGVEPPPKPPKAEAGAYDLDDDVPWD